MTHRSRLNTVVIDVTDVIPAESAGFEATSTSWD